MQESRKYVFPLTIYLRKFQSKVTVHCSFLSRKCALLHAINEQDYYIFNFLLF